MLDEEDICRERKRLDEERARIVVANLKKRQTNAQYTQSREEALSVVLEMIPEGVTVACGDSITLNQIGIIPELRKRNQNKIIHPMERDADGFSLLEWEQRKRMFREAFSADVFLTGTNAVTLDGRLVSTDAVGNRVAAMLFGPER